MEAFIRFAYYFKLTYVDFICHKCLFNKKSSSYNNYANQINGQSLLTNSISLKKLAHLCYIVVLKRIFSIRKQKQSP